MKLDCNTNEDPYYVIDECCPKYYPLKYGGLPLNDPFVLYNDYERGLLPFAGGLLDQPHIYMETMRLLARLVAESQRARRAEVEKENRNNVLKT